MAKKIFKVAKGALTGLFVGGPHGTIGGAAVGLASALKKKKKKKDGQSAPAAATTPAKGPKITPLGSAGLPLTRRAPLPTGGTMLGLSDRLGG